EELAPVREEELRLAALHRVKRRELLAVGFRDHVLGRPLGEVAAEIARVADALIQVTVDVATERARDRFPSLPAGGTLPFAVLAMGKLGGAELNYSSDIDLVFVHDELFELPDGTGAREIFDRVARDVVRLLSTFGPD